MTPQAGMTTRSSIKRRWGPWLLAALVAHLAPGTSSATVFVDGNATGTATGESWANAFTRIQDGIDAAAPGEDVWVAAGTYGEAVTLTTGVAVYGGFAGGESHLSERNHSVNATTIDGSGQLHVVTLDGVSHSRIDGFTITGGDANGADPDDDGGGIYGKNCDATNVIANCLITNNRASGLGGGMFCEDSSPAVRNCAFIANAADGGGGVRVAQTSAATFTNCVFLWNQASRGSAMFSGGDSMVLLHCTFAGNRTTNAGQGSLRIGQNNESASIVNCLFYDNSGVAVLEKVSFSPAIESCLFFNNADGDYDFDGVVNTGAAQIETIANTSNILDGDPMLADPGGGDLHLLAGSPCIDAGADASPLNEDIEGTPRPLDGDGDAVAAYDLGAYEYGGAPPPPPAVIYVDQNTPATTPDGATWETAFPRIGEALAVARPNDEIWVARGVYNESIAMKSGVRIYGGFAGGETDLNARRPDTNGTTLDASGSTRAVVLHGVSNCRLDGFTITGGHAYAHAGTTLDNYGGGILCVSAGASNVIAGCRVFGNAASLSGGGIYCLQDASPTIVSCVITNNTAAMSGGGLYCGTNSSPAVTDTVISGNMAAFGGGVYCNLNSSPQIEACRIQNNTALKRGGAIYLSQTCSPRIVNSILAGNSSGSGQGGALYCLYNCSPALINCTLVDNAAVTGGGVLCSAEHNRGDLTLSPSTPTLVNTILAGHAGQAVYEVEASSDATITHCLFQDNSGGDVYDADTTRTLSGAVSLNAELPEASNVLDGDPLFVSAVLGDFRLRIGSPCIDTGTAAGAPQTDIDGHARPIDVPGLGADGTGTEYDIGAYEIPSTEISCVRNWSLY